MRAVERGGGSDGPEAIEEPFTRAEDAEVYVAECLSKLTGSSRAFCSKELEITHKVLNKQQRQAGGKKYAPRVITALRKAYELDRAREAAAGRADGAPIGIWESITFKA